MSGPTPLSATEHPTAHESTETVLFDIDEFCAVVFDDRNNRLHRLNPSASAVWILCDGTASPDQMAEELAEMLGLDHTRAAVGVSEALGSFWEAGLLIGSPDPEISNPEAAAAGERRILERLHDP